MQVCTMHDVMNVTTTTTLPISLRDCCRRRLMTAQFIEEFSFLLDSGRDGIEVSYNAAGVLSHIASDGLAAWTVEAPDREHVLERLVRAVNRYKLELQTNVIQRFAKISQ